MDLVTKGAALAELKRILASEQGAELTVARDILEHAIVDISHEVNDVMHHLPYDVRGKVDAAVNLQMTKLFNLPYQPDVTPAHAECLHPERWNCLDGVSTEVEICELLYALVRAVKPYWAVETGTYLGFGAAYIAAALRDNGRGFLHTCDIDTALLVKAAAFVEQHGLSGRVSFQPMTGLELINETLDRTIGFAFIDSGIEQRADEAAAILPKLAPGAVVVVHDAGGPFPEPQQMRDRLIGMRDLGLINLSLLHTPRGCAIFTKR
jgi:predicted O-methyltransferase YrrM